MSDTGFGALGVSAELCTRLAQSGLVEPFPIQTAVIPVALAGRDVVGRAPTGSGKTMAFGIPVIANLRPGRKRRPTGLVLAPTRELAEQIAVALRPLARVRGLDVVSIYGGVGYQSQRRALDAGASLVVGCPGRLEDLVSMGALHLGDVRHVVIDEADRLADMGFLPAVRRIVDATHAGRQVLMFSATLDGAVGKLAASLQRDAARHEVGATGPDLTVSRHAFWTLDRADRAHWTAKIVREVGSTLVFCRTRHGADRLAKQLSNLGVSAAPIHGGRSQPQRDRALQAFATNAVSTLVATDVAARGVHVDDVAAVVHYDPPADAATYVHRSGRTARAGASGVVVAMVERGSEDDARRLQRSIGIDVRLAAPSLGDLRAPAPGDDTREAVESSRERTSSPAAPPTERHGGTVTSFRRGFGFIDIGTDADVFVHRNSVRGHVAAGDRVELALRQGRRGLEAFDVVAVAGH